MRGLRPSAVGAALLLAAACGGEMEGGREEAGSEPAAAGERADAGADELGAGVTVDTQKIATDSAKT